MASGDHTGPMGQGPRTGRAFGFCSGYDTPGFTKGTGNVMERGFGFGRRRGMRYSRGNNFNWPFARFFQELPWTQSISKNDEIKMLRSQAETLKRRQKDIEKRLSYLEKEDE